MPTEADDNLDLLLSDLLRVPAEQRAAELERITASNPDLRERLEQLLQAHRDAGDFLEKPAVTVPEELRTPEPLECPGTVIDRYKLLELIGEGGFGAVYMAEQSEPVRRRVALKIIKLGMDTKQVIARFEAERQALTMMDHPNIAKVLDAGATETGRPYFVMELVKGDPVTEYCDRQNLGTRQRLEIFRQVCHAVQHAHQKGVIHRDLKPSNVLVTVADGRPIPKVIDFGIAKATDRELTDKTFFTEFRQLIGTPEYMSPEQAEVSGVDIDTRSDIYALGVLLYELLTGTTPFDAQRLRSAAFGELQRIIREEDPDKPSTRVRSLLVANGSSRYESPAQEPAQSSPHQEPVAGAPGSSVVSAPALRSPLSGPSSAIAIAEHRRTDPQSLSRHLRGELDWIVMKCLEKDRTRRYETANGVAADIQRHLENQPVEAGPPTAAYRVRKFVRRNRVMVTAATIVVAALLAGTAGTTFGLLRAEQRRAESDAAREQTQQISNFQASMLSGIDVRAMGRGIRDRFRESVQTALTTEYVGEPPERRKRTPEEIEAELATFDKLTESAQPTDVARQVMDEYVLARAADTLERRFAEQPLVRARLHFALGKTYRNLGVYDDAATHFRAALEIQREHHGPENVHVDVAVSLYNLAGVMHDLGDPTEAVALYRQSLAMWRELSNDVLVARTLEALGGMAIFQLRFTDADELLSEALRLNRELYGEDDVHSVASTLGALAVLRTKQGRLPEAEALNRQVLQMRRDHFGDKPHPKIALSLHNLAHVLTRQGRHEEAEELFRETLAVQRALYGNVHPLVAKAQVYLAGELVTLGRRAEGEALYHQALALQRELLGDHHPEVRTTLEHLAALSGQDGDHDEAVALLREALAIAEWRYPEGHAEAFRRYAAMGTLGRAMVRQAEALLSTDRQRALAVFEEAEALIIGSSDGQDEEERNRGLKFTGEREAFERTAEMYEFWHNVAPDRGWDERAAEWRARLENLPEP